MNYILIPCTSSAPNRAHDAIVLRVDDTLLTTLRTRRDVFAKQSSDSDLHTHEYRGGPLHYLHLDDDLDAPDGPVVLPSIWKSSSYSAPGTSRMLPTSI